MNGITVLLKETPLGRPPLHGHAGEEGSCPQQTRWGLGLGLPREVNFGALLVTLSKLFFLWQPKWPRTLWQTPFFSLFG